MALELCLVQNQNSLNMTKSKTILFAAILLGPVLVIADEKTPEQKPNILFISIDDLNDWIEPLGGHRQAKTPNLNRLARGAVNFKRAYCPSPGCNPSRTAIMTGLAPYTSGVYSNYQDWREVITDHKTIGAYFREHGYYSTGAGKIYHYHMVDPSCWDEYWPSQTKNMPTELMPDKAKSRLANPDNPNPETMNMPMFKHMYGMFDWYPQNVDDSKMADYKSVDYVISQLNNNQRDKPFFPGLRNLSPSPALVCTKKIFRHVSAGYVGIATG